jgi:predicted SnoaL-like aldol condensation-catalyzing enzyme
MENIEANLKLVIDGFINTVINKRQYDRALEFMHPDFVKHWHDGKPDGNIKEYLASYQEHVDKYPNLQSVVKKSIAYGDEVWLWTDITGLPEGVELEIVEICRVKDGKLFEKWHVLQPTPLNAP